jgi:hypothetical protein
MFTGTGELQNRHSPVFIVFIQFKPEKQKESY